MYSNWQHYQEIEHSKTHNGKYIICRYIFCMKVWYIVMNCITLYIKKTQACICNYDIFPGLETVVLYISWIAIYKSFYCFTHRPSCFFHLYGINKFILVFCMMHSLLKFLSIFILNACPVALDQSMFTYRHNSVLQYIVKRVFELCSKYELDKHIYANLTGYRINGGTVPPTSCKHPKNQT